MVDYFFLPGGILPREERSVQSTQLNGTALTTPTIYTVQGPRGRDGRDGVPGRDGRDGVPGRDGRDGVPGQDGAQGR